jgi:hypothetical protein
MSTGADEPCSFDGLPGAELVTRGLRDLASGAVTAESLLVLVAGPTLRRLGIDVPPPQRVQPPYEHRLYELLEKSFGTDAHGRYNSLLRRVVSFSHAVERERAKERSLHKAPPQPQENE